MVKKEKQFLKRRKPFFRIGVKHSWLLICYLVMTVIVSEILIVGNDYIASATDLMLAGNQVNVHAFILSLLGLIIGGTIVSYIKSLTGNHYSALVLRDVRQELGGHLLTLQYCYFDTLGTGSIMTKLISDMGETGRFFSEILPDFCMNVIIVLTVTVYLIQMDPFLILVLFGSYPIMLLMADWLSRRLTAVVKKWRSRMDERTEIAYDCIQGIVVGRSFNLYRIMKRRIDGIIDCIADQACKSTKITSMGYVMNHSITMIPVIICYVFALHETLIGKITTGQLIAFTVLMGRILYPIGDIVFCVNDIRQVGVSFQRIQEIFNGRTEHGGQYVVKVNDSGKQEIENKWDNPGQEKTNKCVNAEQNQQILSSNCVNTETNQQVAAIEWNNVTFSYDGNRPILQGMSFQVRPGEQVAFAGGSGEGKSTIFQILCGFYTKSGGSFKLFGHEYEDCTLESARDCISLVSQNVFLFPKTIEENVAFGKAGASHEEVMQACKDANIHEFIMRLPEGYDTKVGERGVLLSGGERQRLSIARAFLKNAPILLLDEPTAAVDVGTEEMIQEAISRISKGRTVMTIAHRLSTIQHCDRIYVVKGGRIVEEGTHEDLLRQNGIYAGMYGKEVTEGE